MKICPVKIGPKMSNLTNNPLVNNIQQGSKMENAFNLRSWDLFMTNLNKRRASAININ